MTRSPSSRAELLNRARGLSGLTVSQVAGALGAPMPPDLRRHKGWLGELVEQQLGASAGSNTGPDFPHLGVELKTLPVRPDGRPVESTWVCTISMDDLDDHWDASRVRAKLARVLWIPVEHGPPLADRHFGVPLLWEPNAEEEHTLRRDWEEHMAVIGAGRIDTLTAHHGTALQVRPKAANASEVAAGLDVDGSTRLTLPRGFYLRATFTAGVLSRHYVL